MDFFFSEDNLTRAVPEETKKNSPKLLLDEHIWAYLAKTLREQGF